jgi:tyrosinase
MTLLRRDINTLSDSELGDYIHAIEVLRQRSSANPDDETGYAFQASLHNLGPPGPCEHASDRFFAWHRAHLHYFEKLLQEADPPRTSNVTIPYWDWIHREHDGKFPAAFDRQGLSEPDRDLNPQPLPPDTVEIVTTETQWKMFGGYPKNDPDGDYGRLEVGPHNDMHAFYIGGKMADPETAAEDPIYFSFHCFIDLLWAEWQRRNGMPPPTSPDVTLRGFQAQPKHKVSDFQDTEQLNYVYELTDQLNAAFGIADAPPAPPPEPPKLVATQPLSPAFERDAGDELLDRDQLQFQLADPPEPGPTVLVRVNQLKVPQKGSYMLSAFAHPQGVPFDDSDPSFNERFDVGYAVMWRSHTMGDGGGDADDGGHHPSAATVRFDVSHVLHADVPPRAHLLTLRYIPAPDAEGDPEVVKEVAFENAVMEVYE